MNPSAARSLLDAQPETLAAWMAERDERPYRARQVFDWIFRRRVERFDRMTDLPARLRQALAEEWSIFTTKVVHESEAPDGTRKLLLECRDGKRIEAVLMFEGERRTICISTQVGCGMGCVFCASGLKGLERNLSAGEILEEVLRLRNLLPPDERITNIVVMGMGESLANLDNLIAALDRICAPEGEGLGLSARRVTISTVGLPDKIRKLAALDRQYHLAVSLHAPTSALRDQLVPINAKVGLEPVVEAADAYFRATGRQVTYEYVLLKGVNDRPEHAQALASLLDGRKAHVNLIPYNPVAGLPFERPDDSDVRRFVDLVKRGGVSISVRYSKGRQIDAACGQLRRRLEQVAPV